jgi:hypothetical protein
MPITVSDTFTRANTSTGTLGSTETGQVLAWQNPTNWQISGNVAQVNGTTASPAWVRNEVANATVSIETLNGNGPGVAFWVKDSTNFWMAWLRSNRYVASTSVTCNSCTDCACGGCNVSGYTGCSKSSSTALDQSFSGCGACSAGSCTTGSHSCANSGNGTFDLFTYASCGASCINRTTRNRICNGANACGGTNSSTSCVTSCTAANANNRCGSSPLCGTYASVSCGTACGSTGRSNRNCAAVCSGCTETLNAASSCAGGGGSSINSAACQNCGYTTSTNYDYDYYLRVDRVVNGSATNVVNQFYADLGSSSGFFAAMRVVTSSNTYRVTGYTDTTYTTAVSDTGVLTDANNSHLLAVGHGIALGALGSASPGSGTQFDNFTLTFEPLGGDSVGIITG